MTNRRWSGSLGEGVHCRACGGCGWTSVQFVCARETCIALSEAGDTEASAWALPRLMDGIEGWSCVLHLSDRGQYT